MHLKRWWERLIEFGHMIKFSHSVFALPFALAAAVLAHKQHPITWGKVWWIVVAMVGARSAAMGFNRLVDRDIDAANPRTKNRHLPSGKLSVAEARWFVALFSVLFIYAAYRLNSLCFYLSPVALGVVFFYSFTKRFTAFSHYILGLALSLAPIGAWLAVTGSFALPPIILGAAVLFWVAGFDIFYACQDYEFDRKVGLYSVPRALGIRKALLLARVSHVVSFVLLLSLSELINLYFVYMAGLIVIAALLVYEHSLVRADDLSRLDMAFFKMNGIISVIFFVAVLGDTFLL